MEHGFIGVLFIIVAIIFIFGGRKRLEDLGAGFGGFMREFNKARHEAAAGSSSAPAEPKKRKAPAKKAAVARKKR